MGSPREPPESESGAFLFYFVDPNVDLYNPEPEDEQPPAGPMDIEPQSTNKRPRAPSSPPAPSKNTSTTNSRPTSPMSAPPAKIKKKVPVNPMTSTHTTGKPGEVRNWFADRSKTPAATPAVAPKSLPAAFQAVFKARRARPSYIVFACWSIYQPSTRIGYSSKSSPSPRGTSHATPHRPSCQEQSRSFIVIRTFQSLPHLALEPHQQFIQDSLMVVGLAKLLVNPLPQEQGGRAGIPLENSGEYPCRCLYHSSLFRQPFLELVHAYLVLKSDLSFFVECH
ncbi:hypothetical protein BKA70DRAFT_1437569 [Coprinopsis sp. MPI-PUGE-AT-0042]|nr:hypothetical protein BKA70DRAFT_1437569 [Coprinopsis sp. MPI-PUGE-AT-0042]